MNVDKLYQTNLTNLIFPYFQWQGSNSQILAAIKINPSITNFWAPAWISLELVVVKHALSISVLFVRFWESLEFFINNLGTQTRYVQCLTSNRYIKFIDIRPWFKWNIQQSAHFY